MTNKKPRFKVCKRGEPARAGHLMSEWELKLRILVEPLFEPRKEEKHDGENNTQDEAAERRHPARNPYGFSERWRPPERWIGSKKEKVEAKNNERKKR